MTRLVFHNPEKDLDRRRFLAIALGLALLLAFKLCAAPDTRRKDPPPPENLTPEAPYGQFSGPSSTATPPEPRAMRVRGPVSAPRGLLGGSGAGFGSGPAPRRPAPGPRSFPEGLR